MSAVIKAEAISKVYPLYRNRPVTLKELLVRRLTGRSELAQKLWALRDISFSVSRGRSLGIIGHNGAGKSTLLRLICGLGKPTSGRLIRFGHVSGLLDLGSGFHPDLTGRENIHTGGLLSGLTTREIRAIEGDIIEFAELEEFIDQPIRTYSSGMYLRLAFATAMQFNPAALVIDEILAVGDSRFQQKCTQRLETFRAMGKTLILTSHSIEQIRNLCDEVLVLEEGQVVMQGEPELAIACYIDLMRQRTERRAAQINVDRTGQAATMHAQGNRQGTQEASISRVSLYNMQGAPVSHLLTGSGLTIELAYELAQPLPDMTLLLGIYTDTGVKCFETSVASLRAAFGPLSLAGHFRCQLPAMPLQPGRYFINVGLYPPDWAYLYDYHWHMHDFEIVNIDDVRSESTGMLALQPIWTSANQQ
jgi:lipopolysaccharide transport system ATP-binding protein